MTPRFELHRFTLSNGLAVFYCHTPESAGFEIAMHIDTGSRDETPVNNGVSHFLEHMMFRGTQRHPNSVALARALEGFGGESNAMTTVENTVYWLKGALKTFVPALDAFADFFLHTNFADIETERDIILQELASDYNEDGEIIDTESLAMAALFEDHPLALPIIGTEAVLQNLSAQELAHKKNRFYIPERCALALTCGLPLEQVKADIEQAYGAGAGWPLVAKQAPNLLRTALAPTVITGPTRGRSVLKLQNNPDNQYNLKILWPAAGGNSRAVVVQTFLQRILDDGIASRLQAVIREQHGLVYDISCEANAYSDIGTFAIDATVSTDHLDKLLVKLREELVRLLAQAPAPEEMERIRFRYLYDLEMLAESPARVVSREVSNHFFPGTLPLSLEAEIVKSLTGEDILMCAKQILTAKRKAFVLVGPKARKKRDHVELFLESFH